MLVSSFLPTPHITLRNDTGGRDRNEKVVRERHDKEESEP